MTKRPRLLKLGELMGKWNIRPLGQGPGAAPQADARLPRRLQADPATPTTYYRGVADPKTELITDGIARITPTASSPPTAPSARSTSIVFATGFHVTDSYTYVDIKGRDGEDLVDRWNREGIAAHRGITVADMPNLFFLLGPNTGLGHNSVVFMIESQIRYVAHAIAAVDKLRRAGAGAHPGGAGRVQRRAAGRAGGHGVEHRWLPQLVHRRARRQPDAVEWDDMAVLAGDPRKLEPSEYHSSSGRRDTPKHKMSYTARCRTPVVVLNLRSSSIAAI